MRTLERKREVPQLHVIVVVAHLSAREEGGLVDKLISPGAWDGTPRNTLLKASLIAHDQRHPMQRAPCAALCSES